MYIVEVRKGKELKEITNLLNKLVILLLPLFLLLLYYYHALCNER